MEGTDSCVLKENGDPIIFLSNHVDKYLLNTVKKGSSIHYKKISVKEYEWTFMAKSI